MSFCETDVTTPHAVALLDEYFAFRAADFPVPGAYRTSTPDPTQFTRPRGVFVVAWNGSTPLGCGGVRMLDATRSEIKHVWLRPEARGRRLGHTLLATLERLATELGATEVVLDTNSSLTAAGALYRSREYTEIAAYNENSNANRWYGKALGGPAAP